MDVKHSKTRKGRVPSPLLWEMVHRLTEDEWRQVKAFSQVYGKGSKQFQLLEFLRHQKAYDPELERKEFADVALSSMRTTARYWLVRTATRLAFYQTEVGERTMDVDVLIRWGMPNEALEWIAETKQIATEQEEFTWIAMLLKQEATVARALFQGEELSTKLEAISSQTTAISNLMALEAKIIENTVRYLERTRNRYLATGRILDESKDDYFQSGFYLSAIDSWPISFQIEKLRIDEFNHYIRKQFAQSIATADRIIALLGKHERIRVKMMEAHAKTLFHVSTYYSEIGEFKRTRQLLEVFRALDLTSYESRKHYLRRYIYSLFRASFEQDDPTLAEEGFQIWKDNQPFLASLAVDTVQLGIMLLISSYQLANGKMEDARRTIGETHEMATTVHEMILQVVYRLLHLIVLLDERDVRGLDSYGTNYKRFLKRHLPETESAMTIAVYLTKPSNLDGNDHLRQSLEKTLEHLRAFQKSDQTTFKPFINPMIKWAEWQLKALEVS